MCRRPSGLFHPLGRLAGYGLMASHSRSSQVWMCRRPTGLFHSLGRLTGYGLMASHSRSSRLRFASGCPAVDALRAARCTRSLSAAPGNVYSPWRLPLRKAAS